MMNLRRTTTVKVLLLLVMLSSGCGRASDVTAPVENRPAVEAEKPEAASEFPVAERDSEASEEFPVAEPDSEGPFELPAAEPDSEALRDFLWTEPVPEAFFEKTGSGGSVERVDYASRDYAGTNEPVDKWCYVYVPKGYDQDREKPYDIIYLMHGFFGSAEELFTFNDGQAKNMFDHMIEEGVIEPMLIVAPCFDRDGTALDWEFSEKELKTFSTELLSDLLPAVEGKYHTYAGRPDYEGFCASRDHRAFGGFSMGSVCTWYQFVDRCDVIRYFLPAAGACWEYGDQDHFDAEKTVRFLSDAAEEADEKGLSFLIAAAVGTKDYMKKTVNAQIALMREEKAFSGDSLIYLKKKGGEHYFTAYIEYVYNALPLFFREDG